MMLNGRELPAGKRFFCEETTLDIPHGPYLVRLWINNDFHALSVTGIENAVMKLLGHAPLRGRLAIAEYLAARVEGLTTVQVIETNIAGNRAGSMLYTEPL